MKTMIEDLMNPSAYPEHSNKLILTQTHISNVFIGDEFVYKIKKPVNFGFLDFSTLEKRKFYCNKEVELNSRFSDDVYIGVYPVTYDGDNYSVDGAGDIVDYAVKMRRLSEEDLLKARFKKGVVTTVDIRRIGRAIADFHNNSKKSNEINEFGKLETIKFNTDENFQQTEEFIGKSITEIQYTDLKKWTDNFYYENEGLFKQRIKNGNIRDCHGDLHMEHVVLTDPIIIIDCIEFNDRFRYSDTASEIAFLLMDLEYNDGKEFSDQLLDEYLENVGEKDNIQIYQLINFYKIYRAYVRGKVTSFILNDGSITEEKKKEAEKSAQKYFTLAHSYI